MFGALVDISAGDLRRSINMLQTASAFKAKNLTAKDIESISGVIPDDVIRKIDGSEYKRRQAAPGIKISTKAFGVGRRYPIAADKS